MNSRKLDIGRHVAPSSQRLGRAIVLAERVAHMPADLADGAPGPRAARGA